MAEVTFLHGWHTVLLNMELDISKMNTDQLKWGVNWQQVLMLSLRTTGDGRGGGRGCHQ